MGPSGFGGGYGSIAGYGVTGWGVVVIQSAQNYDLVVANSSHAHTVDNISITQVHNISVANASHSHTVDNVVLTQVYNLTVNNASHGHTADNINIIYNTTLAVNNASHSHTVDSIVLAQVHNLVVANAIHSLTSDQVSLQQLQLLVVNNSLHAHTADGNLAIDQYLQLNTPDPATFGLTSTVIKLTENNILVIDNSRHGIFDNSYAIIDLAELGLYTGIYRQDYTPGGALEEESIADGFVYAPQFKNNGNVDAADANENGMFIPQQIEKGKF